MKLRSAFRPLPLSKVRISDEFWGHWQRVVAENTIETQYVQCEQTGRIENFHRAARGEKGTFVGRYFNDSDLYKWIEAASMTLSALGPNPKIEARLDSAIQAIQSAQMPDGYIDTFIQVNEPDHRFRNLGALHEMYVMGHLLEAAVAHFEATQKRDLLIVAIKVADCLDNTFGPGKRRGYCGHEEIELGLLKLGECVNEPRYINLARFMIDERGKRPSIFESEFEDPENRRLSPWLKGMTSKDGVYTGNYLQDHLPVRETPHVTGHAVRAMYLYAAATEAFVDQNDTAMEGALATIWNNLVQKRMYVTGGIGDEGAHEGFTDDYHLPNRTAYNETCADCGLIFWAQRLVHATGDAEYADILELALYNGMLSGISIDGQKYFYDNPLESFGKHHRQDWFDCACCPPNIARVIASLGKYVVAVGNRQIAILIPCGFEATTDINGTEVKVIVESTYAENGEFKVRIESAKPVEFSLKVRIPDWSKSVDADMPDEYGEMSFENNFAVLHRTWSNGDQIKISMDSTPGWLNAHPKNLDCAGRIALRRGPFIYCAETAQNGYDPQHFCVDPGSEIEVRTDGFLNIPTCVAEGFLTELELSEEAYADLDERVESESKISLIPYFAWDNATLGAMQVWLRSL